MSHRSSRVVFDPEELAAMPESFRQISQSIHTFCIPAIACKTGTSKNIDVDFEINNQPGQWFGETTKTVINTIIRRFRFYSAGALKLPEEGEDEYLFENTHSGTKLKVKIKGE